MAKQFNVEFNDSNLSLTGWAGPRYMGSKLIGRELNKHHTGDITYGIDPIIENKVVALYLGNTIIGGDREDPSRINIQGHSFVSIDRFLLINLDDDSVEIVNRQNMDPVAFRRLVTRDMPEGSKVQVKLLDFSVQNNLKDNHFVKFNKGSLMKIYEYTANPEGFEDGVFGGFGVRSH